MVNVFAGLTLCRRSAHRRRGGWLATAAFLLALPVQAQALAMRHFDNRDGLPQSQVSALLEDRHGFIWASTGDGLTRLGPNGAQVFDGTNGFNAKDVSDLAEDRDGAIWVATEERGLTRIRGREVTVFGAGQGLTEENIHCLVQTRGGELYAGSQHGLFRRRGDRFERVPLPEPWGTGAITALAEDSRGAVWMGSRRGALARRNGVRLEPGDLPPAAQENAIVRLRADPGGQLWALQAERMLRLEGGTAWALADLPEMPGNVLLTGFSFDRAGGMLVALGTDGLYLREADGAARVLPPRDLLCRDAITCAIRDRNGGLWIGTDGDHLWAQPFTGLHSLVRDPATGTDLGLGTVTSFQERPGGGLLLGSNNGVFLWQAGRGVTQHWSRGNGLTSPDVWMLQDDGQGGTWIGTLKGLFRLGSGGQLRPGPPELAKAQIQCLALQGGRIWVGTDKGLAELDAGGRFLALHDPTDQVGFSAVHCLLDQDGVLLAGTSQGVMRFQDGQFQAAFGAEDPTRRLQILALHRDPAKRVWVGTSQGLEVREPERGTWSTMGLEAGGQPLYSITWIRSLADGNIAVGHAKGVTLLAPSGRTFQLTRRVGLISDETNQDAALVDHAGRLWIGMVGGACVLDGLKAFPALPAPVPVILDVAWERGTFWLPERVALPPGFASLAVHADAGNPNTPYPVRFEVRFEESGSPWHPLEPGLASIHFEGLSPGVHRLRLRAGMSGAGWRESAPLSLTIQPAWWQTLWARAALAVLAGLTAFAVARLWMLRLRRLNQVLESRVALRTRELEGSTQELANKNKALEWTHRQLKDTLESRMRMINTVSHDLRSPLTSILLSVDRIQSSAEEVPPKAARILGIMAQEAQRLDHIVKSLLDRNRAESLADQLAFRPARPAEVLDKLEDTLTLKAEARGLRTHLFLEPASLQADLRLDVAAMQQVLFNLVENALKFTDPPGDVGVRSTLKEQDWMLEVWDTGRGIPRAECDRLFSAFQQAREQDANKGWGLGLFICRSIVAAHGGRIEVDSDLGKGAIFTVRVPLAQAELSAVRPA